MCMNPAELNSCIHDLKELRTLQDRITAKIKALEDALKEHMADTDMFTLTGDDYSISWNEMSSTRLDTTALKHDLPDIAAQYMKTNITRRFIVN